MLGLAERALPCGCSTTRGACSFHALPDDAECANVHCIHPKELHAPGPTIEDAYCNGETDGQECPCMEFRS